MVDHFILINPNPKRDWIWFISVKFFRINFSNHFFYKLQNNNNNKRHTHTHTHTTTTTTTNNNNNNNTKTTTNNSKTNKQQQQNYPWVLNFPPCRGPGGSIPTGNVTSVVSSNCPLWKERRENTTRLPWVAARKPEEGILEVESYWEFGLSWWLNTPLWTGFRCRRVSVRPGTVNRLVAPSPRKYLFFLFLVFCIILILTVCP